MKKKIFNYLFLIILMVITIRAMLQGINASNILYLFGKTNKLYVLFGVLCMILYWVLDASIIYQFTKHIHKSANKLAAFKTTMIGQYYSNITPFSAGTQPSQLYYLGSILKIPYGEATAILLNKYIIYESTVTAYSLASFLIGLHYYLTAFPFIVPFTVIGLIIHTSGIILIIFIVYSPRLIEKSATIVLRFLSKLHMIKEVDNKLKRFGDYMKDYRKSLALTSHNKILLFKAAVLTFIMLTVNFSIAYFVYKSLNLTTSSFLAIIALQAVLYMSVSVAPTPGTLGASEAAFYTLFKSVFTSEVTYALLLWRGISFYFSLTVSGILAASFYIGDKRRKRRTRN